MNQHENSLETDRERTDKNLSIERAKTDDSLVKVTEEVEIQTDAAVMASRSTSDEANSQARLNSDSNDEADIQLRQERQTADEALESERARTDALFADERNKRRKIEQILIQERKETDQSLASEREKTDDEVSQSYAKFVTERERHLITKEALTTRDEFLAIVSHDLRNPLASISMAVDHILSERPATLEDDVVRRLFDLIRRNTEEALRLISDLLDMESIAIGKLSINLKPQDLNEIIQYSIEKFKRIASVKNLSFQFTPSLNPVVAVCDRDRTTQVISNLINNAIKFTPKDGVISLSVKPFKDEFVVSVKDTGPGIKGSDQTLIFERFSQIKNADRRGLGLGLYISEMLVKAQAGKIWVDSKYGCGSTFCFTLPKYPEAI